MSAFGYPISLELRGKRAVVIGRGAIEMRRPEGLRSAGAEVTVIDRPFRPGDLEGAYICVASSEDAAELDAIRGEADERRVLLNVIDDIGRSDWAAPAIVRRGDLTIAISTGGRSPALAKRLREELDGRFGREWARVLDVIERVRAETSPLLPNLKERSRRWSSALDLEELAHLVREDRDEEACTLLRDRVLRGSVIVR